MTNVNPKEIAKKAKAFAFDSNVKAFTLFYIMANIGGEFGLITRWSIPDIEAIEIAGSEDSAMEMVLEWLPWKLASEIRKICDEEGFVNATFMTCTGSYDQKWHISASSVKKTRIENKIRRWARSSEGKEYMKANCMRKDSITMFHWM